MFHRILNVIIRSGLKSVNGGIKNIRQTKNIFADFFIYFKVIFMRKDTFEGKKSFLTDSDFDLSSPFDLREGQKSCEHLDRFKPEGQTLNVEVKSSENS
ncbi:MAG: hypothetical protein ACI4SB_09160 [Acutalibacteraceae bacterium]